VLLFQKTCMKVDSPLPSFEGATEWLNRENQALETRAIPRRISAAVMHALAKHPNDRPQTATELAREL
jgi:hypothetical protein